MSNIVSITGKKTRTIPARNRRPPVKRLARREGASVLAVSAVLLSLSLSHVAEGVGMITGSTEVAAWAMAVGIEAGYVSLELSMLLAPEHLRARVSRFAYPAITGTLVGSAALNAMSFAAHAEGGNVYWAVVLGVAIPALVYALSRVGAVLYTGRGK